MAWTEERIALLKRYWLEGRSAAQIAEALGEGLTRNAVIGKAHRLGLANRPQAGKGEVAQAPQPQPDAPAEAHRARKGEPPADAVAPPEPAPAPAADAATEVAPPAGPEPTAVPPAKKPARAAPKVTRVTLLDLNDRICKWPIGHPNEPDFHFCGKPVAPGFPYCSDHCTIAYQSQAARRERPPGPPPPFRPNLPRVR
ncbi:GcrA family cell cycle regulator [Thermaurantiacus sp.]